MKLRKVTAQQFTIEISIHPDDVQGSQFPSRLSSCLRPPLAAAGELASLLPCVWANVSHVEHKNNADQYSVTAFFLMRNELKPLGLQKESVGAFELTKEAGDEKSHSRNVLIYL